MNPTSPELSRGDLLETIRELQGEIRMLQEIIDEYEAREHGWRGWKIRAEYLVKGLLMRWF